METRSASQKSLTRRTLSRLVSGFFCVHELTLKRVYTTCGQLLHRATYGENDHNSAGFKILKNPFVKEDRDNWGMAFIRVLLYNYIKIEEHNSILIHTKGGSHVKEVSDNSLSGSDTRNECER